jgi:hypothetical protein
LNPAKNDLGPNAKVGNGTLLAEQESNRRKAVQRREVLTAWFLLSSPMIGFVAYLTMYLGLHVGAGNLPLFAAVFLAVVCLFLLSWVFISHTEADWRKTTRFIAFGLLFEGIVLVMTRTSGREASIYFGIGSLVVGLVLLFGAKRN